jgi:hypothetical protein
MLFEHLGYCPILVLKVFVDIHFTGAYKCYFTYDDLNSVFDEWNIKDLFVYDKYYVSFTLKGMWWCKRFLNKHEITTYDEANTYLIRKDYLDRMCNI